MNVTTYPATQNPEPKAIVIFCFDPRFRVAFFDFIEKELGLKPWEFIPLIVAGGPAPLAHPKEMFHRCRNMIRQIMFTCNHFRTIKRVYIIGHQDCGYYGIVPAATDEKSEERERSDLPVAKDLLRLIVPEGAIVETFYAEFTDPERREISFERIS